MTPHRNHAPPPARPLLLAAALFATLVGLGAGARRAEAHPLDIGYLRIETDGASVAVTLDLDVKGVVHILGKDGTELDAATVAQSAREVAVATYQGAVLESDLGPCPFAGATASLAGQTVSVRDRAECPAGSGKLRWSFPFVQKPFVSTTFQLLVRARVFGAEHVATVDKSSPEIDLSGTAPSVSFGSFVWSGVEHIGAAPSEWHGPEGFKLPDGIDHILFLLGLILGGGTLLQLVGIASGFTVGHSITLALAALNIVRLPPRLVESVIALTIAVVAAEAFFGMFQQHRWKIATCFGLVHGFGFANALTELDLSGPTMVKALFGYNLGVELGQVALVLVIAPLVLLANRNPRLRPYLVRTCSALIFCAGIYWFFERAFAAGT